MRLTNGSALQARFLGGALGARAPLQGLPARLRMANARMFGADASWPQGYQSVLAAMVPPIGNDSPQMAATLRMGLDLAGAADGIGQAAASLEFGLDLTAGANILMSGYATIAFDMDLTAAPIAFAQAAAVLDWVSRPTASDIAQEVWNSFSIEGGLSGGDVMRVMLAALAGKVSGAAGTTVTIRDTTDAKDRIVATVDASGNRTAVTLDGST